MSSLIRHRTAYAVALAIVVAAWLQAACASAPIRTFAIASEQLAASVSRLQQAEIELYRDGLIPSETHRAWQSGFKTLAQRILLLNTALRVGNAAESNTQIGMILGILDQLSERQMLPLKPEHQLVMQSIMETTRVILVSLSIGVEE